MKMIRWGVLVFIAVSLHCDAAEVNANSDHSLVEEPYNEIVRKKIVRVLGDLKKYQMLIVGSEASTQVYGLILNEPGKLDGGEIRYWRDGLRKPDVVVLDKKQLGEILDCVGTISSDAAKEVERGKSDDDQLYPLRMYLFYREKPNQKDWLSVSIRQGKNMNKSVEKLFQLIMPKEALNNRPNDKDFPP